MTKEQRIEAVFEIARVLDEQTLRYLSDELDDMADFSNPDFLAKLTTAFQESQDPKNIAIIYHDDGTIEYPNGQVLP